MPDSGRDAVIWGLTASGRPFRPSDWCDRLAGLASAFGPESRPRILPLLKAASIGGVKAVIVGGALASIEPRLYQFLVQFARDNGLVIEFRPDAIDSPQSLVPPAARGSAEPREPV